MHNENVVHTKIETALTWKEKRNIDIGEIGKTRKYYIILDQKENIIYSLLHVDSSFTFCISFGWE